MRAGRRSPRFCLVAGRNSTAVLTSVARPWVAAVGLVASIVQLITVPWPLGIRLSIVGVFVIAALLTLAYYVGVRRGAESAIRPIPPHRPVVAGSGWRHQDLTGARVVKVPKRGNVAICELHHAGSLHEQWLPLSPDRASFTLEPWTGNWSFADDILRIDVGQFRLALEPHPRGIWTGVEHSDEGAETFVAAIVDPRPVASGQSWTGLKLGEHGVRRVVHAEPDGRLKERDPFDPGAAWEGSWALDPEGLHVRVDRWSLFATPWSSGVFVGVERSDGPEQGFAVVRVREPDLA